MKKSIKKKLILLSLFLFLILFTGLCFQKRRGIVNTFFKLIKQEVPYTLKAKLRQTYGSYTQAVKVDPDLKEAVTISENDASSSAIRTDIPAEVTLIQTSVEIDAQLDAELSSGNYSFQEPLIILNPYRISPLTAVILFQTEKPYSTRIVVKGKTEEADLTFETEASTLHRIPVLGLYPGTDNTVSAELLDSNRKVIHRQEYRIQTDPLPETYADAVRTVSASGSSAFPLTIVSGQQSSFPFAYDCLGDIRWYLNRKSAYNGVFSLSNGNFIFQDSSGYILTTANPQATNLYEMDYLGRASRLYYLPRGTHHDITEKTPNGNLMILTSSLEGHFDDEIVEIDRKTGEIVNTLNLEEIFGNTYVNKMDWAHLNTVSYQEEDDSIIISPRNLHSVIKINWSTHELQWILCDPRFWEGTGFDEYVLQPKGDMTYHFQQHAAYPVPTDLDGNPDTLELSLFDNHQDSGRPVDYLDTEKEYSYSIVYSIDESAKTVQQIKKLPVVYSKITSNTIYDPDSNHIFSMCGYVPNHPDGKRKGMTYEMDYSTGEILNQFSLKYTFYRAIEMNINYQNLCGTLKTDTDYIKGSLRPAVKTEKTVKTPERLLETEVSFTLMGSVLYTKSFAHHVGQVIFKGENHTYVYDNTCIPQYNEDYLKYESNIPIPLSNLEPDTYEILVVYLDTFYRTGQTFSIS